MDKCFGKVLILFVISVLYVEKAVDIICIPLSCSCFWLLLLLPRRFSTRKKKKSDFDFVVAHPARIINLTTKCGILNFDSFDSLG